MPDAGFSALEISEIKAELQHYENARQVVKLAACDYVDLKTYEPAMRHLFDSYIRAQDAEIVAEFGELGLLELIVKNGAEGLTGLPAGIGKKPAAMAETIENNVRKVILDESPVNPKYYERMSELLDALIAQRREDAISYKEYLEKIRDLAAKVIQPAGADGGYPATLDTSAKRALYDNLGNNEDLAILVDAAVKAHKKDGWAGHRMKERELASVVRQRVQGYEVDLDRLMELLKNQEEYR
jgi:type I restriction enzyme R subunit